MIAARRRFIQRTLGVVGYVALLLTVVPIGVAFGVYAYRAVAADRADAAVNRARAELGFAGPCQPPKRPIADARVGEILDIPDCEIDPSIPIGLTEAAEAAAGARSQSEGFLFLAALFSLASLPVSVVCLWIRHFLALADRQT